ncbi:MAG: hypothetical protein JWQ78_1265 [Sediminibacterium sp.]|nr:hypothetical protein [Sediminibacterium sp.]
MSNGNFVIERRFQAPVQKVWQAITDSGQMKAWYFDIPEFKAEVGFEFQFSAGPPEKLYLHLCKVLEVIVEKKLSYSWRYEGYEGNSVVSFELFPEGDSTRLQLTHTGLESFPANDPNFAPQSFAAGWTQIIGTNLAGFLSN